MATLLEMQPQPALVAARWEVMQAQGSTASALLETCSGSQPSFNDSLGGVVPADVGWQMRLVQRVHSRAAVGAAKLPLRTTFVSRMIGQ